MSRKHKNNHYHYAEKYSDRSHHERMSVFAKAPLLFMILVLLGFGCISTTFSVFVSTQDTPQLAQKLGMQVAVRNKQVNNPMADSYAVAPEASDRIVEPTEEVDIYSRYENSVPANIDHVGKVTEAPPEMTEVSEDTDKMLVRGKEELADTGRDADLADTGGAGNTNSDWHISNSVQNSNWDSTSAYKMTKSSASDFYYDFYFIHSDTHGLSFRFFGKDDNNKIGAYYGNDCAVPSSTDGGTSKDHAGQGVWGWTNTWKFTPSNQLTDDGKFYRVRIHFGPALGYTGSWNEYNETRNFSGRTWYTTEALSDMNPTFSSTSFLTGSSYDLTSLVGVTSGSNVGTVSYATYQYYDGSWHDIGTPASWTPASTSITKLRVTATDGGVISSGTGKNAHTARTDTDETTITVTSPLPDVADSVSLSKSPASGTIYAVATPVTYTASVTNPQTDPLTYTFYVDDVQKQTGSSNTYQVIFDTAATYNVKVTVSASGYESVSSSNFSTTVTALPTVYFNYNTAESGNPSMTYDADASAIKSGHYIFKLERTWKGNSEYHIKVWDGSDRFKVSGDPNITDSYLLTASSTGYTTTTSGDKWIILTTNTDIASSSTGKFTFYWDYTDKKLYVEYPHKVSYNMQSHGTQISDEIVPYNGKVTQPTAPSADGYDFGGWYEEAGCSNAWNFSTGTIIANKTLYAKWTPKAYTITLDRRSGSGGTAITTATYGSALTAITVPTRAGYEFGGYFTGTNGSGTKYYDDKGVGVKSWDIAADTTLYAKWTIINYTITLHTDSGSYVGTAWTNDQAAFTVESSTIALPDLEKTGYTFQGWYEDSSHTGIAVTEVAAGSTGNREYYAYFTLNSYTVKLIQSYPDADTHAEINSAWYTGLSNVSANQSQTVDDSANCVTTFEYNVNSSAITLPAVVSNENLGDFSAAPLVGGDSYLFAGWYTTSDPAVGTTPVTTIAAGSTGNKTYYAKWTAPIAVHFVNDVTGQETTRYVSWGGSVADANVPSPSAIPGFTFNTWYSQSTAQNNFNSKNNVTAEQYIYAKYTMSDPQFNATLTAKDPDTHQADPGEHVGSGTGLSSADPYMVNYGAELTADASVATTYTVTDSYSNSAGVWYSWSVDNENYTTPDKTSTGLTYTQTLPTTKTIASSSPESIGFNLKVRFYSHSAQDYVEMTARVNLYYQYYGVESPIRTMKLGLPQRIYQSSDSVSAPVTDLVATISSRVPASYVVALRKFSNSALSYNAEDSLVTRVLATKGAGGNFTVNQSPADTMSHTFNNLDFNTYFNSNGVKSFTYGVEYPDESDPPVYTQDSELEVPIKNITVGTNSYVANHPVFLKFTGVTEPTGRIMMYYIQNGDVVCQTGARIRANLYRFSLPDAVTNVYFADAAIEDDNDEVLEYVKADPSDFSDYQGYFKAWSIVQNIPVGTQTLTADLNESTHTIDNFVNSAL